MIGPVADVVPHWRDAHALAVPLDVGGGTRLKILEAFAAGLPVVSTPVGCEGIAARDGEHLVVADRRAFASAIVDLLRSPERAAAMAERARAVAIHQYDWAVVGRLAGDAVAAASQLRPRAASQARLTIPTRVPTL
jgi:glycosyltransferase involved in cell wall biosynthesis